MGILRDLCRRVCAAWHMPGHWQLRPGTIDRRLFRNIVVEDEYRLPRFSATDTVLDIGAHVGSFALAALRRGAGLVVCCEPDPGNFSLLWDNLSLYGNRVRLLRRAVWPVAGPLRLSNPLDPRNTGAFQARPDGPGEKVEAIALDDLLAQLGRVRLAKLDCEGAEWPLLFSSRRLDAIAELRGEYHLPPLAAPWPGMPEPSLDGLRSRLVSQGFAVEYRAIPRSPLPVGLFSGTRTRAGGAV